MIFQEPMVALDPVFTIGEQIAETIDFEIVGDETPDERIFARIGAKLACGDSDMRAPATGRW
jgi:ABC-type dipeptide/oligopeptide/nickel transport system ATPase component